MFLDFIDTNVGDFLKYTFLHSASKMAYDHDEFIALPYIDIKVLEEL